MQPDYVKIQLQQQSDRPAWSRFLPEKLLYRLYFQPSKMRVTMDNIGDFQGLLVELPWNADELENCKEAWFHQYLIYLGNRYGVGQSACFITDDIKRRFHVQDESYQKYLKMLLLKGAVNRILHKNYVQYRQAKIVIIDDGSRQAEYVIEEISRDANYLTVITDRQEELQNLANTVLHEHGLAITLIADKDVSGIRADVVVNLISEREKLTTRICGSCSLFDFGYTDQKALRLQQMNSQIQIFHGMKIKSVGDVVSLSWLSQIFYYKDKTFQDFVNGNCSSDINEMFNQLWDSSFIEMVKVY